MRLDHVRVLLGPSASKGTSIVPETKIIRCPNCGTKNRIDGAKLAQGLNPLCGKCKRSLSGPSSPVTVTDASFVTDVVNSSVPVLLDLWAPWCGPCRAMAPILDDVAAAMSGRACVAKLNVDDNPITASRFQVTSIPTLLVFKDGREVQRLVGGRTKHELIQLLEELI